jgi:hypothetical protein
LAKSVSPECLVNDKCIINRLSRTTPVNGQLHRSSEWSPINRKSQVGALTPTIFHSQHPVVLSQPCRWAALLRQSERFRHAWWYASGQSYRFLGVHSLVVQDVHDHLVLPVRTSDRHSMAMAANKLLVKLGIVNNPNGTGEEADPMTATPRLIPRKLVLRHSLAIPDTPAN